MARPTRRWILVLAAAWLGLAPPAHAEIEVFGALNRDTRWTRDGSPYVLTWDVTIGPAATLIVDPGVEVVAPAERAPGEGEDTGRIELVVRGTLLAVGTQESPVVFRSEAGGRSSWAGIRLEGEGSARLEHVRVEGARTALDVRSGRVPHGLVTAAFTGCETALRWASDADLFLADRTIAGDCDAAVRVLAPEGEPRAVVTLRGSSLSGSVVVAGTDMVVVQGNTVRQAWTEGADISGADAVVVEDNDLGLGRGLRVEAAGMVGILRNTVASCRGYGIDVAGGVATVANNEVVSCSGGIAVQQVGDSAIRVVHNTVVRPLFVSGLLVRGAADASLVTLRANIVVSGWRAGVTLAGGTGAAAVEYNDVWDNDDDTIPGGGPREGNLSVAPDFVLLPAEPPFGHETAADAAGGVFGEDNVSNWVSYEGLVRVTRHAGGDCTHGRFCSIYLMADGENVVEYRRVLNGALEFDGVSVRRRAKRWTTGRRNSCTQEWWTDCGATLRFTAHHTALPSELMPMNLRLAADSEVRDVAPAVEWLLTDRDGRRRAVDPDGGDDPLADVGAHERRFNHLPRVDAGGDQTAWLGAVLTFDGRGTEDPDGEITAWQWDFGDGTPPADTPVASHEYEAESPEEGFLVTLTVWDDDGGEASGTARAVVTVRPDNVTPVAEAGESMEVWVGQRALFDASGSHDPDEDGWLVSWRWSFSDGMTLHGERVERTFPEVREYMASLVVTDDRGGQGHDMLSVWAREPPDNVPPVAEAGDELSARVGEAVAFDGSASHDEDGWLVLWHWDFGDGSSAWGARASHVYAEPGEYQATLTVTDDLGGEGVDTVPVRVEAAAEPDVGSPDAGAGDAGGDDAGEADAAGGDAAATDAGGLDVGAADARTADAGEADAARSDGGRPDTGEPPVEEDGGAPQEDAGAPDSGSPENLPPEAVPGSPLTGTVGVPLAFDGSGSSDPDGDVVTGVWDFGDETGGVGLSTTHTYVEPGEFTVTLTVHDDRGGTARAGTSVTIAPRPSEDGDGAGGGCACATPGVTGGGGLPALGLLVLLGLRRRRAGA